MCLAIYHDRKKYLRELGRENLYRASLVRLSIYLEASLRPSVQCIVSV